MKIIILVSLTIGFILLSENNCYSQAEPDSTLFVTEVDGLRLLGAPENYSGNPVNDSTNSDGENIQSETGVILNKEEE